MIEDTVNPPEEMEESVSQEVEQPIENEEAIEKHVPLSALQKERRKRQEMEMELKFYKENQTKKSEPQEEEDVYASATKADLNNAKLSIRREIEEENWKKQNPEKFQKVSDQLTEFLKQRPNLAAAIAGKTNRYEEAWELMDKLSPKEKQTLKVQAPKKEAPGSPGSVPKSAALDQAVDIMSMSDNEYQAWRATKRQRRA